MEHVDQLVTAFFPIQTELHSMVIKPRAIVRIELAAAAVFRGAVERAHPFTLQGPDTDALGLEILLRNPEPAPGCRW